MIKGMLLGENNVINGKSQRELEYTFLGWIKDFTQLEKATKVEEYEQWWFTTDGSRNKGTTSGTIRVRSIDNKNFSMTVKHKQHSKSMANESKETEVPITKDMFDSFKKLSPLGVYKTRHFFPIEGTDLTWELDVFTMPNGDVSEWCMIDLEVKGELEKIPEPPIDLEEFFNTKDRSTKSFVDMMMNKMLVRNSDSILPLRR
jgi:CYTH domain-containing protein